MQDDFGESVVFAIEKGGGYACLGRLIGGIPPSSPIESVRPDGGNASIAPKEAVKAAALLTKQAVAERLERNLGSLNAAEFTHGLRTQQKPFLN
jgi:hypothetical protein